VQISTRKNAKTKKQNQATFPLLGLKTSLLICLLLPSLQLPLKPKGEINQNSSPFISMVIFI
jgi:hypothetical protein